MFVRLQEKKRATEQRQLKEVGAKFGQRGFGFSPQLR